MKINNFYKKINTKYREVFKDNFPSNLVYFLCFPSGSVNLNKKGLFIKDYSFLQGPL